MDKSKPQLDYATHEKPQIEPWQPTRAAAIALIALGSCVLGILRIDRVDVGERILRLIYREL